MTCSHGVMEDHSGMGAAGRRIWRCSVCERRGTWDDSWSYYGAIECKTCHRIIIDCVVCSDACREKAPRGKVRA